MILGSILAAPLAVAAQSLELEVDSAVATAGFFQLRWFADAAVELQEAATREFSSARVVYSGQDAARVMSGKPDGEFFYRIRNTEDGAVSNVVKVTVRHHSLERAFAFFTLGAVVFLATLLLIAGGARAGESAK